MFNKGELFANFKPEWLVVAPFLTGGIKQMSHIGGSSGVWGWGGERKRGEERGGDGRGGKKEHPVLSWEINSLPSEVLQTQASKQIAKMRPRIYT